MKYVNAENLKKELSKAPVWTTLAIKEIIDQLSKEEPQTDCETCRDKDAYDEWEGNCDECENGSMYTPQTERSE